MTATQQETKTEVAEQQVDHFSGQERPFSNPRSEPITLRVFDERSQAHVEMGARWEEIDPPYARYVWNNLNKVNRKVKIKNANRLARAIESETFATTGETIIFDANGDLQNGQHRIYGVAKGGKPIVALVVRGANPRNFTKIDRGAVRRADDCLHIRGVQNADAVARLARRVKQWEDSKGAFVSRRGSAIANDEILSYVDSKPALITSANYVRKLTGNRSLGLLTPTWLAFLHYVTSAEDLAMGDEFIRLLTGPSTDLISSAKAREVISHLRARLDRLADGKRQGRIQVSDTQVIALALAAWNVFCREGRNTIKKLVQPKRSRDANNKVVYTFPTRVGRPTPQAKASVLGFRQQQLLLQQQLADQANS